MTLLYNVKSQELTALPTSDIPRRGSVNYLMLQFEFAKDWQRYPIKTVFLRYDGYTWASKLAQDQDGNYTINVPEEFTKNKSFQVQVVGSTEGNNAKTVPTNSLTIEMPEAGDIWLTLPPKDEIPVYAQLVALATEAKAIIGTLPQYRGECFSQYYYQYLKNVDLDGAYSIESSEDIGANDWLDRPTPSAFILLVYKYDTDLILQIAITKLAGRLFTRSVKTTADGENAAVTAWQVLATHAELQDVVSRVEKLPQYRGYPGLQAYGEVGSALIANIDDDGAYSILSSESTKLNEDGNDWADRPTSTEFCLLVYRFGEDEMQQIAITYNGRFFTRHVEITEDGEDNIPETDWSELATQWALNDIVSRVEKLPQYRGYQGLQAYGEVGNALIANIDDDGAYSILTSEETKRTEGGNDWADRPTSAEFCLLVYKYAANLIQQIAIDTSRGFYWTRSVRITTDSEDNIPMTAWKDSVMSEELDYVWDEFDFVYRAVANVGKRVTDLEENKAFTVVDGKVCTTGADVSGEGWHQVEAAAEMDEPYLNEWGWKCAQEDGTTELYKWIYRCLKEGFSVPYRTIIVDGVEHRFATELTERDRTWVAYATNPETGQSPTEFIKQPGYDPAEAAWFCVPLVQFGSVEQSVINHAFERVRLDNPILCAQPLSMIGYYYDEENGNIIYAYFIYWKEAVAQRLTNLIETAKKSIDKYVELFANDSNRKLRTAEIIHDYIILNNDPATVTIEGAGFTPQYYMPSLYAALAPNRRALCDGYTQAFNYFARLYGINSLAISAKVDHVVGDTVTPRGGHIWNIVNFGQYGVYSADPSEWSPIDVYWDEPLHEAEMRPGRTDLPTGEVWWEYFGNPTNVFKDDYRRTIKKTDAYGRYPFDNEDGSTPNPSGELNGLNEFEDYEWEVS